MSSISESSNFEELFKKYLNNNISADELENLLSLLNERRFEGEFDVLFRTLWERSRGELESSDVRWDIMLNNIRNSTIQNPRNLKRKAVRPFVIGFFRAAVAAVILFFITFLIVHRQESIYDSKKNKGYLLVEKNVPVMQKEVMVLPDGSKVTLNAGSKLTYDESFGKETRAVRLNGEALFEVTKDSKHPFFVITENLTTRVVGTKFNVKAYQEESKNAITVLEGKVKVTAKKSNKVVELIANEQAFFDTKYKVLRKVQQVNAEVAVAWNSGVLAFEDATLADIANQFYRKYGVKLTFDETNYINCRLSLTFQQESPEDIVRIISSLTNSSYKRENNEFNLLGKGCPPVIIGKKT